jgi:hypothetical protein
LLPATPGCLVIVTSRRRLTGLTIREGARRLTLDVLDQDDSVAGDEESEAVRPVFTWSYRALPSDAARLFRLLGLHPGPDFSDTAAAALAGVDVRTARRLLDAVAAAHMAEQTASDRFRLHDLLRAYAADQARREQTPLECQEALRRALTWYLHTADAVQARVRGAGAAP